MRNIKSFTLVETLIATFIMIIALGALVYSMSYLMHITNIAQNRDIAINAASEMLAKIGNTNINLIEDEYNGTTFSVAGLEPLVGANEAGSILVDHVAGAAKLFEVIVRVDWQQRGRPMNVQYDTVFAVKQ